MAKKVSNAVDIEFIDMKTARPHLDSPASICCQVGNADMLQLLLDRGLSPQTSFVTRFGETPSLVRGLLTQALIHREYEVAKVLISHGADLFSNSSSYILPGNGAENSFTVSTVKGEIKSPAEMIEELDYKTIKDLSKVISANFNRRDLGKLGPKLKKEVQDGLSKASKNPAETKSETLSQEERDKILKELLDGESSKPSASAKKAQANALSGGKKAAEKGRK